MITTEKGERDEKATRDRLHRYMGHHHARVVFLPVEYPARRTSMIVEHQGKEYDAHIRVSHGQVLLFESYGAASSFKTYPLRRGSLGKKAAGEILQKVIAMGPSLAWLNKSRRDREAKEAERLLAEKAREADKLKAKAVAQVKGKVTRVAKTLGLQDRVTLHGVSPEGTIDSVTINGPWTPAQINELLRFIKGQS